MPCRGGWRRTDNNVQHSDGTFRPSMIARIYSHLCHVTDYLRVAPNRSAEEGCTALTRYLAQL